MDTRGCSIVLFCVVASSCGVSTKNKLLKSMDDTPQPKDEVGLPKSEFEKSLLSADTNRQVQASINLAELVFADTAYKLTCSASWASQETRFIWQLPLHDVGSEILNFVENTDGTFNHTSTIYLSFTESDDGSPVYCTIIHDHEFIFLKKRINVHSEINIDVAKEKDEVILTSTVNQWNQDETNDKGETVSVKSKESKTVRPSINPVAEKGMQDTGYITIILIITPAVDPYYEDVIGDTRKSAQYDVILEENMRT